MKEDTQIYENFFLLEFFNLMANIKDTNFDDFLLSVGCTKRIPGI